MANETVVKNQNVAPFVPDERDAGEADIYPGHAVELTANGNVVKHDAESSVNTKGVGRGTFAVLSRSDPELGKSEPYPDGERVSVMHVPVGGKVDAFLAAGGDLDDASKANIEAGEVLEEVDVGALAQHDGTDTVGDGTGLATETVYDQGALYVAEEAVDNSGAAAGVSNQVRIEVTRIA
ncbi:MAG: hypothetical protein SV760_06675 [Halobacteria archaeon]|nr:hypothetical protein [Halobacteria archaeon]